MTPILTQLYYGEINPYAWVGGDVPKHQQIRKACMQRHDAFLARLDAIDPTLREEMDQMLDEQLQADLLDLPEAFIHGFRVGAKMMLEVLMR